MRQALFYIIGLFAFLPLSGMADTLYVTDKIHIALRPAPDKGAAALKMIASGTPLELLAKEGNQARVRDPQQAEGWVETGYLTADLPARAQLEKMQAQLQQAQTALAQETAKTKELADKLAQSATTANAPPETPKETGSAPAENFFNLGWLAFSFAMLIVGFFSGIQWIREVYRRRLGGMYLRI